MDVEQQIRNTIIQGILNYDENIFVVDGLDDTLQSDLDCYVKVDVSLSEATGSYAKSVLDQGQFTIGDKGVYARIKIDKVFINKNDDAETSNKLFWIAIRFKTKIRLELLNLLNEIKENIEQQYNIYYYGLSLQPKTTQNKKFCDLFLALSLKDMQGGL
jgi:hypothetical protein